MNSQNTKSRIQISIFLVFFLSTLSIAYINGFGFRFNLSESLPHKFYFSIAIDKPELGQIVNFKLPYSQATFAKIIAGIPGDNIFIQDREVFINNVKIGKVINPFEPISEGSIPEEHYFVIGIHPESFDSRYQIFGLVHRDLIKEKLCPIF